ncbi:unnamed protein product [Musa acuminata subsp. malaccensis]|uniref:(wild Malaysian banana) hypothetical protein n=1 Tax=Musa acuminata subsp. malaccensis TaxID=214687 RepID=A0A804KMS2_MUSAM|nr:PREDICTED: uncharacterized protein LOC103998698 [Musa acuminata subsp. malaccensis]CAG1836209.1 unnamed protein product [Musa acuminata subsp. malaccensis]
MADDAERMAALKRAYADIILNTAKESAARILASEGKVLQLQRSLSLTKEDSLAMLLRLKAIMDSKIHESEKANLSQVGKIQELEAQLSEAKVTIDCLRSELKRLNSELDHKRDIQAEFLNGKSTVHNTPSEKYNGQESMHNSGSSLHSPSGAISVLNSDCCFSKGATEDEPLNNLISSDTYAVKPDLTSIILSNKEPELCRSGYTQRIHAFEWNPVTGKELTSQMHDQVSDIKSETLMCENEKSEKSDTKDFAMKEKIVCHRKQKVHCQNHVMKSTECSTYHDMQHYRSLDTKHIKVSTPGPDKVPNSKGKIMCENEKAERPWTKDFVMVEKLVRRRKMRRRRRVMRPTKRVIYHDKQHYASLDPTHSKVGQTDVDISADNAHWTGGEVPPKTLNSCSPQVSGQDQETTKSQRTKLNKNFSNKSSELLNGNKIMTRRTVLRQSNTYSTGSEVPPRTLNSCSPQASDKDQETTRSQRTKLNNFFSNNSSGLSNDNRIMTRSNVLKQCSAHGTGSEVHPKTLKFCSSQVSGEDQGTESQRNKLNKIFSNKNSGLLNGNRITTRRTVLKQCNASREDHIDRIHTSNNGTCPENSMKEPFAASTGEMINDALSDEYVKNDKELEEKMSTKPDHIPAEELDNSVTKENNETINEPHYDYRDELSGHCGRATEVGGDKILKYTFQRKRKRGSLDGKVEPTSITENISKRKVGKDDSELEPQESSIVVESCRPEPQKSSLVVESSRDSRRLAQVARQLISLSERRWW